MGASLSNTSCSCFFFSFESVFFFSFSFVFAEFHVLGKESTLLRILTVSCFCGCFQNLIRACSVLLGPSTSGLWRALVQSQNHIPGGGPAELTGLLRQYSQNLAKNMKLTYLNPVALVAPNLGEFRVNHVIIPLNDTTREQTVIKSSQVICCGCLIMLKITAVKSSTITPGKAQDEER